MRQLVADSPPFPPHLLIGLGVPSAHRIPDTTHDTVSHPLGQNFQFYLFFNRESSAVNCQRGFPMPPSSYCVLSHYLTITLSHPLVLEILSIQFFLILRADVIYGIFLALSILPDVSAVPLNRLNQLPSQGTGWEWINLWQQHGTFRLATER